MERSAARGRYREITPYLLLTNEMSSEDAILLTADELVNTNKDTKMKLIISNTVVSSYTHKKVNIFLKHTEI